MNMTPEQMKQVKNRLDTIWPKPRICPICQCQDWKLHLGLYIHQALHGISATKKTDPANFDLHQEGLPSILFWCDTCGYVATFFAEKFGITVPLVK